MLDLPKVTFAIVERSLLILYYWAVFKYNISITESKLGIG